MKIMDELKIENKIKELLEQPGYYWEKERLNMKLCSVLNWYAMVDLKTLKCPVCNYEIKINYPKDFQKHEVKEQPDGITYGHRWLAYKCKGCETTLCWENFDR